jgi:plasmid stability protein
MKRDRFQTYITEVRNIFTADISTENKPIYKLEAFTSLHVVK